MLSLLLLLSSDAFSIPPSSDDSEESESVELPLWGSLPSFAVLDALAIGIVLALAASADEEVRVAIVGAGEVGFCQAEGTLSVES